MNFILYKETNFKGTPIGKIPSEWEVKKLVEVINCVKGRKPKKLHDRKASEMFLPYLTAEYMRGLEEPKWCNPQEDQKLVRVEEGDVIMIWDGSYAGHVFTGFSGILASTMIKIVPNREVNGKFLYYFLAKNFQVFRGTTAGTGIPHVSKKIFDEFPVLIPSVKEQQKIAEILSTVDKAIQKTNEIIAKTERLKKGLMQELLTKGIGHKEFKDTEIGRIPKNWEVVSLEDVSLKIRTGPFGSQLKKSELSESGLKVYTQENILKNDFSLGNLYISYEKFERGLKTMEVKPGDVLLTIRGSTGCSAVFPEGAERGIIHTNLAYVRVKRSLLLPKYLSLLINDYPPVKSQVTTLSSATTLGALYAKSIKKIKIPLPSLQEQLKITEILSVTDKKLEIEKDEKAKLERIKQGLMDLLLTGKIRVKV